LASSLHYDVDQVFTLTAPPDADEGVFKPPFPAPCTIGEALMYFCDIFGKALVNTLEFIRLS
jgi:hypothetical protein